MGNTSKGYSQEKRGSRSAALRGVREAALPPGAPDIVIVTVTVMVIVIVIVTVMVIVIVIVTVMVIVIVIGIGIGMVIIVVVGPHLAGGVRVARAPPAGAHVSGAQLQTIRRQSNNNTQPHIKQ